MTKRKSILKNFFKKDNSVICPYCNSKDTILNRSLISSKGKAKDREYIIHCNSCNAVGVKKETWYEGKKNKFEKNNIELTDIELSVD